MSSTRGFPARPGSRPGVRRVWEILASPAPVNPDVTAVPQVAMIFAGFRWFSATPATWVRPPAFWSIP